MIEKLNIENFMLFKKLEIPTLKRVNLIGGRNNSGKTTLLEALRILTAYGDTGIINTVLDKRKIFQAGKFERYDGLFNNKLDKSELEKNLKINNLILKKELDDEEFEIKYYSLFLRASNNVTKKYFHNNDMPSMANDRAVFIPFFSNFSIFSNFWENIVLTPREDDVIEIIRETIEPSLIRLDIGKDKIRIRLEKTSEPVPLQTLGDGVQRILLIALGLANAKNSYLLIDEIELGLHHSILEKLWKMIFKYAKKWNIQVFVTTHSQDALRTFTYIASEEENKAEAQFIRLQIGRTGANEAILFDTDRLIKMLDLKLEIR